QVKHGGDAPLFHVAQALDVFGFLTRPGQGGQEQGGQDGDDRDDHEEFNERKGRGFGSARVSCGFGTHEEARLDQWLTLTQYPLNPRSSTRHSDPQRQSSFCCTSRWTTGKA